MCVRAHTEQDGLVVVELNARVEDWSSRRRNFRSLIYWTFLHISAHSSAPHTQAARHTRQSSRTHRDLTARAAGSFKISKFECNSSGGMQHYIRPSALWSTHITQDGEETLLNLTADFSFALLQIWWVHHFFIKIVLLCGVFDNNETLTFPVLII